MLPPTLEEIPVFLMEARRTLHLSQEQLGQIMGVSKRTVLRMEQGRSTPIPSQYERVARALYPVDPALAAHYAAAARTTLEAMGLVASPAAPDPATSRPLADSIVCVAAEAMDASPRAVRPALVAAFERMRSLGLGVDAVLAGLSPENRQAAKPAKKSD